MAQHRRRSGDGPEHPSRPRKRSKPRRPKTDLSAFLDQPLSRMDDAAFDAICRQMFEVLAPRNGTEQWLASSIIQEFAMLRRARMAAERGTEGGERLLRTATSSFRSSQQSYDLLRRIMESNGAAEPEPSPEPEPIAPALLAPPPTPAPEPEPEPLAPEEPESPEPDPEVEEVEAAFRDWRARIAIVPHVDPRWPVLDRLGLVVDDILTLRDRGCPEEEIFDRFPGMSYPDLAACYACEVDGYRGPLEPPYPDDLAVLDRDPDDA